MTVQIKRFSSFAAKLVFFVSFQIYYSILKMYFSDIKRSFYFRDLQQSRIDFTSESKVSPLLSNLLFLRLTAIYMVNALLKKKHSTSYGKYIATA